MTTLGPLSTAALRPARSLGRRVDRRARQTLARPASWLVLSAVDAGLSSVDSVLASPLAQEVGKRVRASALPEALEPIVAGALESPDAERLVRRVVDSRLIDGFLQELQESEALWLLIGEIAQSPAVTDAISRQSLGLADQMAGVVRSRSRNADDRLERLARRLARRRNGDLAPNGEPVAPGDEPVAPGGEPVGPSGDVPAGE